MKSLHRFWLLLSLLLLVYYLVWRSTIGFEGSDTPDTKPSVLTTGVDRGLGNVVGIQPSVVPADYATPFRFEHKVDSYLAEASRQGFLNSKSIVVFPEYFGTWLLAVNEKSSVYTAKNTSEAMTYLVLRHPYDFVVNYRRAREKDPSRAAVFRMKSEEMARIYQEVFSTLAKKYGVTLVAGSILLVDPGIDASGQLISRLSGRLYNVSVVFDSKGNIVAPIVKKIFPVEAETYFMAQGSRDQSPVFDTPAGKLGVLVCADAWYPEAYRGLENKGVEILAIPSNITENNAWQALWKGYDPGPFPKDVDPTDVGRITEGEAWKKYSMGGRAPAIQINLGMNVFLRGKMWDLGADGHTLYLKDGQITETNEDGALITNVWIEKINHSKKD